MVWCMYHFSSEVVGRRRRRRGYTLFPCTEGVARIKDSFREREGIEFRFYRRGRMVLEYRQGRVFRVCILNRQVEYLVTHAAEKTIHM